VVYQLTKSNTAVGAVSILQFSATMLLTPWMGGLSDRINRQRMLLTGQATALLGGAGLAITVFILGIEGLPGPWPVYLATAVIGLGAAIILPSLQAIVPALVNRADLDRAITLNSMTFNIARGIGPIAAGAVVAAFGAKWAFGINAVTFLPLLLVLFIIDPPGQVAPDQPPSTPIQHDVREGLTWISDHRPVLFVLLGTLVVGWTSDPFSTLMPAMAESLGGGDATVGLLVGAFGLGAAITAPNTDAIRNRVGRERFVPTGLFVVTSGLVVVAFAPVTAVALLGAAMSGSGFLIGVTGTNTELQKALPERLRGRIMAWWSVAFLGCRPLAALTDGGIADLTDVRVALGVSAAVALTAAAYFWRRGLTAE
jgi:MFS family permease